MADKKISELNAITGANTADDDVFVIVDTSAGETKKITRAELEKAIENIGYQGAIKLATTSTGIDVTGTATMDGLTVEGASLVARFKANDAGGTGAVAIYGKGSNGTSDAIALFNAVPEGSDSATTLEILNRNSAGSILKRMDIDSNGDISFYETTGTTAKFFWDASLERLQVPDLEITAGKINTIATAGAHTVFNSTGADADFRIRTAASTHSVYVEGNTGNVGIGTSSPQNQANVTNLAVDNATWGGRFTVSQGGVSKGGLAWDSYRAAGGQLQIFGEEGMKFRVGGDPATAVEAARIDSSGHLIVPNGITLGTAVGTYNAANTLDDYESGTWTATLTPSTSGSITASTTGDEMRYTKIGNKVTVTGAINISSVSSPVGGTLTIGTLPFARENSVERSEGGAFSLEIFDASTVSFMNKSAIHPYQPITAGSTELRVSMDCSLLGSNDDLYFTATYFTA